MPVVSRVFLWWVKIKMVWTVELRSAVRDNCRAKRTTIVKAANYKTRIPEKCMHCQPSYSNLATSLAGDARHTLKIKHLSSQASTSTSLGQVLKQKRKAFTEVVVF